jgi:hypothetical protein
VSCGSGQTTLAEELMARHIRSIGRSRWATEARPLRIGKRQEELVGGMGLGDALREPSACGNAHVFPVFAWLQDTLGRRPAGGPVTWGRTGSVPTGITAVDQQTSGPVRPCLWRAGGL